MPRWLRITGVGCGGLAVLFVVFFIGVMVGGVDTDNSSTPTGEDNSEESGDTPERAAESTGGSTQEPLTFSGAGAQVTEPIEFSAGLAIFEMSHQGESNFIVDLVDVNGEEDLVISEIGAVDVSQGIRIPEDGTYRLNVDADGPWTIRVR